MSIFGTFLLSASVFLLMLWLINHFYLKPILNKSWKWLNQLISFLPVIAAVFLVRSFVVEPYRIPSASMEPTVYPGDFILVNKAAYALRLPLGNWKLLKTGQVKRGDLAVFFAPDYTTVSYIKRVIGVPGDTIEIKGNRFSVNGKLLKGDEVQKETLSRSVEGYRYHYERIMRQNGTEKTYITKEMDQMHVNLVHTWKVPEGHYFMLGDNRDNSRDSRFFGLVSEDLMIGKAFFVWMHWSKGLPDFFQARGLH